MKLIINTNLFILLLLLAVSLGSAHGTEDGMGSDHAVSDNKINMNHDGFEGFSDHMKIKGEIRITDSVKLTISAEPTEDMMNDHMGSSSNMMKYSNEKTVSITKIVEFVDLTNNGYSEDDFLVSEFVMNQTTMYPVDLEVNSDILIFVINSKSNVINITVDMLSENDSPYAFKWSIDIIYPFVRNDTRISILHELDSIHVFDDMIQDAKHSGDPVFGSNMMTDNDEHLPMFFSWDDEYILDGEIRKVIPNLEDNIFSLSFDQGTKIIYDPQIGFDPIDIKNIDGILENMGQQFWETVKSPTPLGIMFGLFSLGILFSGSRFVKSKKK